MSSNLIPSGNGNSLRKLTVVLNTRRKNGFVRYAEGAYKRLFVEQIERNIAALAVGKLRQASMFKIDKRSGALCMTWGYGPKKTWFPNDHIPREEWAEFHSPDDAVKALGMILQEARSGAYDTALAELQDRRQKHADKMLHARIKEGFRYSKGDDDVSGVAA